MRKLIVAIVSILLGSSVVAQSFEGQVIYKTTIKSKTAAVTDEQWSQMMGTSYHYFIKGGNYRTETNGNMAKWQLYLNNENKLYTKMSGSDVVQWNERKFMTTAY